MPDPYQVLGLRPGATADEVRAAYRRLAREHHPDVSGRPDAAARFAALAEAYERLSDPAFSPVPVLPRSAGTRGDPGVGISEAAAREVYDAFFRAEPADAPSRTPAHPFVSVPGTLDLTLDLPISAAEAGEGASVTVPTPDGPRTLRVPPGTPDGRGLRVPGLGVRGGDALRGDLIVRVRVVRGSGVAAETLEDR